MEDSKKNYRRPGTSYVSGNTARKIAVVPNYEEEEQIVRRPEHSGQPSRRIRRRPAVGRGIDFFSMIILMGAIAVTLFVCIKYLQVQSDTTQLDKKIVLMEKELQAIQDKNAAIEAVLYTPIDWEYVKQVAVGELGMVFPKDNETLFYSKNQNGYVRQYEDVPEVEPETILDKLFP